MTPPSVSREPLLAGLLKSVSRSFYLTLRILPAAVRPQIGLAYLLARASDTIADTHLVPAGRRLETLDQLRGRILGSRAEPLELGELVPHQASRAEVRLLERTEEAVVWLHSMNESDRAMIRDVLNIILSGQRLDLERFELQGGPAPIVSALSSDADLEDYTYRVAGCVGEFWTRVCGARLYRDLPAWDQKAMERDGVRFGKGLQLINILRDLPADLRAGRCYLPRERLASRGLSPESLVAGESLESIDLIESFYPLYGEYLDLAEEHLAAGWRYTLALPRRYARVRLGCAWPLMIGNETLRRLRATRILSERARVKVSRREVWGLIVASLVRYPWPRWWAGLMRR